MEDNQIQWTKCRSVTTDGAPSMTGIQQGGAARIKQCSPDCVSTHCMIHREALAAKKLGNRCTENELSQTMSEVIKLVNGILAGAKSSRAFSQFVQEIGDSVVQLIYHCDVRWLSRG